MRVYENHRQKIITFIFIVFLMVSGLYAQIPQNGLELWLKSDAGITKDSKGIVTRFLIALLAVEDGKHLYAVTLGEKNTQDC